MHVQKRPGLKSNTLFAYGNAMAKWLLRIELQELDPEEHHPIYSKIYSAGEILDHSFELVCGEWGFLGSGFEEGTFDQEKTITPVIPR